MSRANGCIRAAEAGTAFLLVLLLMGAFAALATVAVGTLVPPEAGHARTAAGNLDQVRRAAELAWLRQRAFPRSLDLLATQAFLPVAGAWRRDPYGPGDLAWSVGGRPSTVTVRSRGPDRRNRTADDPVLVWTNQTPLRAATVNRLRTIRARLVAWQIADAASRGVPLTTTQQAALRDKTREYARVQRQMLFVDAAGRAALGARLTVLLAELRLLRQAHGIVLKTRLTGGQGLLRQLGLPDGLGRDAGGRRLRWNETVGCISDGGDRRGSTSDDF